MGKMLIEKKFRIPEWNEESRGKVAEFWGGRGVTFTDTSESKLVGTRGSLLGNATSFDMQRLLTTVNVEVLDSNECTCTLDITTSFQIITSWNKQFWQLELDTFESFMLQGDYREEEWASYCAMARKADWKYVWRIGAGVFIGMSIYFLLRNLLHHFIG